ncbi:MAG TPA: DUF4976 domain-containing protein [Leeuwenhoekiella sp.]|nr:DUF4976 domain-containing protein [Leeuwenhoekiella sp.]
MAQCSLLYLLRILFHFYYDINQWKFYDLKNDPHETNNVYKEDDYADVMKSMKRKLKESRKKHGDTQKNDDRFLKNCLEATQKSSFKESPLN